jgi:molybdenum cofactor guanylyltransferase
LAAEDVTGLILAGGAGSRMGGIDKGLALYRGRPLVAHAIERLLPQVATIIISANRNIETYAGMGFPVQPDRLDGHFGTTFSGTFAGPLYGLAAGLSGCTTPWLVTCPCDTPEFPRDLVARLLAAVEREQAKMAVAVVAGRMQPTFQLCRKACLPELQEFLAAGQRKLGLWCKEQQAIEVVFPEESAFKNLNCAKDLQLSE